VFNPKHKKLTAKKIRDMSYHQLPVHEISNMQYLRVMSSADVADTDSE
jgi:hypothetical protein